MGNNWAETGQLQVRGIEFGPSTVNRSEVLLDHSEQIQTLQLPHDLKCTFGNAGKLDRTDSWRRSEGDKTGTSTASAFRQELAARLVKGKPKDYRGHEAKRSPGATL